MKYLSIDRFEGGFAVCEDDGGVLTSYPCALLPPGTHEGDVVALLPDGSFVPAPDETARRRAQIAALEDELFE